MVVAEEISSPVTGKSSPAFNGNHLGVYTFTPVIEGYSVSAVLPQINVSVINSI